jgi:glycine/serine hydroxymethyltransferase
MHREAAETQRQRRRNPMSLMDTLKQSDPEIAKELDLELNRQRTKLELIASENIVSRAAC